LVYIRLYTRAGRTGDCCECYTDATMDVTVIDMTDRHVITLSIRQKTRNANHYDTAPAASLVKLDD